jgi:acyl-CoA reductase-like NAD-dependent aldehyde dehydrogenase
MGNTNFEATIAGFPTGILVGGEFTETAETRLDNINPATEAVLASVSTASAEDVDRAVAAAREALRGTWRRMSGSSRGQILFRLAALIERDAEKFFAIKTLENGTPPGGPEVPMSIDLFQYFGGWADKIHGRVIPTGGYMDPTAAEDNRPEPRTAHVYTVREPVGVVACIIPWNSPTLTTAIKLAPILASGCTAVIKTSEESMQAVLHLGSLLHEAGLPDGVVNILNGRGDVGAALVAHPGVDHVSFTGSPDTGRAVATSAAAGLKGITLELGGKSPQLIFADADIDRAAQSAVLGVCANQGQACLAGSRILVHQSVYERTVELMTKIADGITVGDPTDPRNAMGALISARQLERVLGYIEVGKQDGAELVSGGYRLDQPGYFVRPTLFAGANNQMRIAREEIFGPVGTIIPFEDDEEAVAIANDTEYGLGATIWTSDVSRAHLLAAELEVGAVSVNAWSPLDARVPHNGRKISGLGSENGWSAIEDLTEEKSVTIVL